MPKSVEITVPSERTDALVQELQQMEGLITLSVQRQGSLKPPGDVIRLDATSTLVHQLLRKLADRGLKRDASISAKLTRPEAMVSAPMLDAIALDENEATPEEMELEIARESTMAWNGTATMAIAGVIGAVALATNAMHLLIAAMVIAPGFEPISRIGLGLATRSRAWVRGALDLGRAYAAVFASALVVAALFQLAGTDPRGGGSSYHAPGTLVVYFGTIDLPAIVVSGVAGVAGALLIATRRSVLTAGVMIALALIPAILLVTSGLVTADWDLAGRGLLRWLLDAGLVVTTSFVVFRWKAHRQHRVAMAM
jgi:peptidoglycan hydrolase-like protein with peptidoglycan-binding domain